jgi:hypothetical protein
MPAKWTRHDRTKFGLAKKPAPTQCPDCNGKLGPVTYSMHLSRNRDNTFTRECPSCLCYIEWTFPETWKRRHKMPLFERYGGPA